MEIRLKLTWRSAVQKLEVGQGEVIRQLGALHKRMDQDAYEGLLMHAYCSALAAELRAVSAEHLLHASDSDVQAMAASGVVGVLLPATAYSLRKACAPARRMVERGLPIAVATDCNPGSSYTESMPFVFGLAVLGMGLSVNEVLVASTLNAAYAIGEADAAGSLSIGKRADLLLLEGETPGIAAFHAGVSPVSAVYVRGTRAWPAEGFHP